MWYVRHDFLHQSARGRTGFPRTGCLFVNETAYSAWAVTIGGGIASRTMRSRIATIRFRVTAASAKSNVTYFACRVTLAPILASFSRSVSNDQCFTSWVGPEGGRNRARPAETDGLEKGPSCAKIAHQQGDFNSTAWRTPKQPRCAIAAPPAGGAVVSIVIAAPAIGTWALTDQNGRDICLQGQDPRDS
jgi:hypothetical protein